ncbi:MAG: DNA translocase FtsK, partial [Planctomycetes bacterium]|nr:DNA translocase FtsK [Planctomycetota bacterium]
GLGTFLILLLLALCALVLATDTLLIEAAQATPRAARDAWQRLRALRLPRLSLAGGAIEDELAVTDPPQKTKRKSRSKKATPPEPSAEVDEDYEVEEDTLDLEDDLANGLDLDGLDELLAADPIETPRPNPRAASKKTKSAARSKVDFGAMDIDPADIPVEIEDLDPDEELDEFSTELDEPWDEEADDVEEVDPGPLREPVIRRGGVQLASDGIEILRISRAEHMIGREPYVLPPITLLEDIDHNDDTERDAEIKRKARKLEETLATFGIQGEVVEISRGPTITVYEIELAAGTKVKRITSLPDDISMALKAKTIRIVAPIPGKSTVGIEVPNDRREKVRLRELALSETLRKKHFKIPLFLGKNAAGDALIEDLTSMPHLLIAGQTGSGKSVCINSIIASLLLTKYPEEVRLILIDPKMVELQAFRDVPHLLTPVVTDMKKAPKVLDWAVNEMEHRYEILSAAGVRDIGRFNALGAEEIRNRLTEHFTEEEIDKQPTSLPYVVVIVDELADLMMTSAKEVETSI